MRGVPLHGVKARGRVTWVSESKYDQVMAYRWHVWQDRRPNGTMAGPYARTALPRNGGPATHVLMHQLIMGCKGVDHRNGYGLDNTGPNLRKATATEQMHNQGPRAGSSAYKGVYWDRRAQRWHARIRADGKRRHLGYFTDEEDAARAYDTAAVELHGEFVRLNLPAVPPPTTEAPLTEEETTMPTPEPSREGATEPALRNRFRNWLGELDDDQIAALAENWDNVMDDAALDRVDSWVIAARAIAELRSRPPASVQHVCGETGYTTTANCPACQAPGG